MSIWGSVYEAERAKALGTDSASLLVENARLRTENERLEFEYQRADESAKRLGAKWKANEAEIERLRGLFKDLRAAWFKGGDLDKDHISQEALRIFIEAERGHQQGQEKP